MPRLETLALPSGMPALLAHPDHERPDAPLLIFLHGMGEAGTQPNELPKVLLHQPPPYQSLLGHLPEALVLAPQAPPTPNMETWNWRQHVAELAAFVEGQFPGRRRVATGFSRGGLGVLQLVARHPNAVEAWAAVDPQPTDGEERAAILASPLARRGWLRYGNFRTRNAAWTDCAAALRAHLPPEDYDHGELDHGTMALRAYQGDRLSDEPKATLYEHLGLRF
jgi:pimeloyl-ACP methyl ester carboxylesterase